MKKGKLKKILIFLTVIAAITTLYFLYMTFATGKQSIKVVTSEKYYVGKNINSIIEVRKKSNNDLIKSKLKVVLKDEDDKSVKGTKQKYNLEEGDIANVNIEIPEDLETGKYYLQVTSKSKLLTDKVEIPILIESQRDANISIFLDKGIYKPKDELNYRVLITSIADDKPIEEPVNIYIYDANGNKVYSESDITSEYGIISGKFILANEVNSGDYKITVERQNSEFSKTFKVNPYIVPKFEANILTDKDSYLKGEEVTFTIAAKYFFGEPVKNASITGKIDGKDITGITDDLGNFIFKTTADKAGRILANLEITDTSNYSIEASKIVMVGTDIFEIEILPEYGNIIKGVDNEIFVITKNIDGTPVKTYGDIKIGNISRQVITDENGIGKILLSSSDVSAFSENFENVMITAKNMEDKTVYLEQEIDIQHLNKNLIKTDKVKYNVGDDITAYIKSNNDSETKYISIFKGNELLNLISTDNEEVTFNLGDTYGIVDIYISQDRNYSRYDFYNDYEYAEGQTYVNDFRGEGKKSVSINTTKKTIFIKPNKELAIDIKTDKTEYKPKENLNILFETKDETSKNVEAALLVSILDDAILNLADNDLSIDNIKLALSNIEISNEISAADIYAAAIDEKSETTLMSILLKQNSYDNNVATNKSSSDVEEYVIRFIISLVILVILLLIILLKYSSEKVKIRIINSIRKFIIFTIVFIVIFLTVGEIFYDLFEEMWLVVAISLVITIILYLLVLYKYEIMIFKMLIDLVLLPIIFAIMCEFFDSGIAVLIALVFPLIYAIFTAKNRNKPKKANKFEVISKKIAKSEIIAFLTYVIGGIVSAIIIEIINVVSYDYTIEIIATFITFILIYLGFSKILFKNDIDNKKVKDGKIIIDVSGIDVIGVLIGVVLLIILLSGVIGITRNFSTNIGSANDFGYQTITPEFSVDSIDSTIKGDASGASNSNPFDGILSLVPSINQSSKEEIVVEDEINFEEIEENDETSSEKVENVRNVFLESLAFIPEVVTINGKAEENIKISDNITTWNIQVVGNTKNGNVGYNTSSIKVFKEFFIDFSLPTNSVVTDNTNIPVTIYNYTEENKTININVVPNQWSTIGNYTKQVSVEAKNTAMIYVPIEIIKSGNNTLRIEADIGGEKDIVEKTMEVKPNGLETSNIISSGTIDKKIEQDIIFNEPEMIPGTEELTLKLYPSAMTQVIEGMENILSLPTGCFEQTSSSLYPNILALEYLEQHELDDEKIREKALGYISSGYQRILTFEVPGQKGGYSLYGDRPAETVITAFGLMELTELSNVYDVDENVLENMREFLFENQKIDGSFKYNSTYIGSPAADDDLTMSAYITWALSETDPEDERLEKSIEYLENNLDKVENNYTLALITNVLVNVDSDKKEKALEKLNDKVIVDNKTAYVTSNSRDYYGSYGRTMNIQATALTSIAFTNAEKYNKTNGLLINYLVSQKDIRGTWYSTQSTVLGLKALIEYEKEADMSEQEIKITLNGKEQTIKVDEDALDLYEIKFDNVQKENKIKVEMKKGKACYEIIQNYYSDYSKLDTNKKLNFEIEQEINTNVKVNEKINQTLKITNVSEREVMNGLVQISIPQGCIVDENSLLDLKYNGNVEKYEYGYGTINLYLRNLNVYDRTILRIDYKALYPEKVTGGAIRVYDYYNPDVEQINKPVNITVTE